MCRSSALFSVIAVLPAVLVAVSRQRHARPRPRPAVSTPHQGGDRELGVVAHAYLQRARAADRTATSSRMANELARARPLLDQDRDSFRRYLTSGAQARNLPGAMLIDKDRNVRGDGGDRHQPGALRRLTPEILSNVTEDKPEIAVSRQLRRGGDPPARLRRHVPLCRTAARSARRQPPAADAGRRRRVCRTGSAAARHPGRVRADVHRHRADAADVVGADRTEFRQLAGGADPPADGRGQSRLDRRPARFRFRSTSRKAISPIWARPSTR